MTFRRVLVAVDDSPAGLDAARTAVDLAGDGGVTLRAITVLSDGTVTRSVGIAEASTEQRLAAGARSVLAWVARVADGQGVACELVEREGAPARLILEEADAWDADLIVMGRSDRRGPSSPYLGSETAYVLEFTDRPVLVVPRIRSAPSRAG